MELGNESFPKRPQVEGPRTTSGLPETPHEGVQCSELLQMRSPAPPALSVFAAAVGLWAISHRVVSVYSERSAAALEPRSPGRKTLKRKSFQVLKEDSTV